MHVSWDGPLSVTSSDGAAALGYRVFCWRPQSICDLTENWRTEDCSVDCTDTEISRLEAGAVYAVRVHVRLSSGRLGNASDTVYCPTVDEQRQLTRLLGRHDNDAVAKQQQMLVVRDLSARLVGDKSVVVQWRAPRRSGFLGYKVAYEGRKCHATNEGGCHDTGDDVTMSVVDVRKEVIVARTERQLTVHDLVSDAVYVFYVSVKYSDVGYSDPSTHWVDLTANIRTAERELSNNLSEKVDKLEVRVKEAEDRYETARKQLDENIKNEFAFNWKFEDLLDWVKEWRAERGRQSEEIVKVLNSMDESFDESPLSHQSNESYGQLKAQRDELANNFNKLRAENNKLRLMLRRVCSDTTVVPSPQGSRPRDAVVRRVSARCRRSTSLYNVDSRAIATTLPTRSQSLDAFTARQLHQSMMHRDRMLTEAELSATSDVTVLGNKSAAHAGQPTNRKLSVGILKTVRSLLACARGEPAVHHAIADSN